MKILNVNMSSFVLVSVCLFHFETEAEFCDGDYHVVNNVCVACPSTQSNLEGDDSSGQDTTCDTCRITTNQELKDHVDRWIVNSSNTSCGEVIGDWEVGRVTDLSWLFYHKSTFNADISNWNTASVTSMEGTFVGATSFNGDLSNWNTSNVTDLIAAFYEATSFTGDGLLNWDTSKVTSLSYTFREATSFTGDGLLNWDTSRVTDLTQTFVDATSFNGDLSNWNTSSVTNLYWTFRGATSFTGDGLSNWNTSRVTTLYGTFYVATSFTGDGVSNWDTSSVITLENTFRGATSFTGDGVSNWDTSSVTSLYWTFRGATSFTGDGVSNWNTSSVTDLTRTFFGATSFTGDGVSNWDTSRVTSLIYTFGGATSFTGDGVSNCDTSRVTDLIWTFACATSFTGDGVSNWDTSSVTSLWAAFTSCDAFNGDLSRWNTTRVTNLNGAFAATDSFTGESIANWDTSKVTDLSYTFYGISSSFDPENIQGWNIREVSSLESSFSNSDLTECEKYELYNAWSVQSNLFRNSFITWGNTTRECGCQIGNTDDALWLALESWTRNGTSHLVCGENITLWDTSKLTVLNRETICVAQEQCGDISTSKPCPPLPAFCTDNEDSEDYATRAFCCVCGGGTTIEVCSWDTESFTADLSLWNVQGVTDMSGAFSGMTEFNSDLSSWNVSRVTDMTNMFQYATSFNSDLSRWTVDGVVEMDGIFEGATSLDVCNLGSICRSWGLHRLNDCDTTSYPECIGTFENVTNQVYGGTCGFNTTNCTCNKIDGIMTTRYCNNDDGCGPIPPTLGMCSNLLDLTLSHGRLSGSIPSELTRLVNLLTFDISNNDLTDKLPNNIGNLVNLKSLDVSNNALSGSIPESLSSLTSLEHLYLDNNRFEGSIRPNIFTNLTSLKELYLSFNTFSGAVPYMDNHHALVSIVLHSNNFDEIRKDTFTGSDSLRILSLARQNSSEIVLGNHSFRGIPSEAEILLSGNVVRAIPTGAFDGRHNAIVDLQNLEIHTLHSNAFTGTSGLSILLQGNPVSKIFPDAFPIGVVRGENCSNYVGWNTLCSEFELDATCDQITCPNNESPYFLISKGVSAVDACCALGGGHPGGANLIMDEISPITCASANSSSDEVTCECSVETERYNVESYECVSSCMPGMRWEYVISDAYDKINSDVGRCVPCLAGTYSVGSVDGWTGRCLNCSAGTFIATNGSSACIECSLGLFTSVNGSTVCTKCPAGMQPHQDIGSAKCDPLPAGQFGMGASCSINTYSNAGSVTCTTCPSGKYSDMGASQCIECDFMYRLSTHCDVPITGMLLIVSALIVVVVASLLFRRYKKKQDRIKQKLRLDLHRQKQLVKTKQTDINLLTGTFFLSVYTSQLPDSTIIHIRCVEVVRKRSSSAGKNSEWCVW